GNRSGPARRPAAVGALANGSRLKRHFSQEQITIERKKMNIAVIYYSSTGNVHALAESVAEGAREAGASVRLRRVTELAPDAAIDANRPGGHTSPPLDMSQKPT